MIIYLFVNLFVCLCVCLFGREDDVVAMRLPSEFVCLFVCL